MDRELIKEKLNTASPDISDFNDRVQQIYNKLSKSENLIIAIEECSELIYELSIMDDKDYDILGLEEELADLIISLRLISIAIKFNATNELKVMPCENPSITMLIENLSLLQKGCCKFLRTGLITWDLLFGYYYVDIGTRFIIANLNIPKDVIYKLINIKLDRGLEKLESGI